MRLGDALPARRSADILARQIIRSGTSVGANYRAACRARTHAEFISKLGIVEEETDETLHRLEMIEAAGHVKAKLLAELIKEGDEILSIVVASIRTARARHTGKSTPIKSAIRNPKSAF